MKIIESQSTWKREWRLLYICGVIGIFLIALISPWNKYFISNFLLLLLFPFFVWFSGAILCLLFKLRPAAIAGAVFSASIFVVFFDFMIRLNNWQGDSWILMVFSSPIGFVAYITVAFILRRFKNLHFFKIFLISCTFVLLPLLVFNFIYCYLWNPNLALGGSIGLLVAEAMALVFLSI